MNSELKPNFLKPRWRKVFSDLWDDKTRTGLVVASISVGVFAIGMIIASYVILGQDIDRSYAAVNPPNIVVWTAPFDSGLVRVAQEIPGVRQAEGRRMLAIRARRGRENWQNQTLVGMADFKSSINLLAPIAGTQYPADGQVIISQNLIDNSGFNPGDTIEIEMPDGSQHYLEVAGLVTDQTNAKPEAGATVNAFVSMKTLRSLGLDNQYNQLYVTVQGPGSDARFIAGVAAELKQKVENSRREVYRTDEKLSSEHPMKSIALAVLGVLGALGGLITVLSSSLIINTLNALLTQQLRQIGIMKLVGARSHQILGMYLTLIAAYSLVALALAVPLGAIAGYTLAWFLANLMGGVLQGFRIVPLAVLFQVLIAFLIPVGAGFFPVNSGARTHVLQAISNDRPAGQARRKRIFRLKPQWFSWIPRPVLLSFRNTFRKRGRLVLTIFTLTVAGAVFIAVFNVRDSMSHMMDQLMQHFMGDVTVTFRQPYKVSRISQTLLDVPGVVGVEGWGGTSGEIWDAEDNLVARISIAAPPQDTHLLQPDFVAGRWLLPAEKDSVVISDTIYTYYPGIKPGDSLILKIPGQPPQTWKIVGIFRFVAMLGDPLVYANFEVIADKMHLANQASSFRIVTHEHDSASQQALSRRIDQYLRDGNYLVGSVRSGNTLRASASQGVNTLIVFLLIMAILTAFVGSIGLTGTMSINVLERTREIGVMRTIGAVDHVIMQSVIIEGLVIGLITWLLAIGLSFPISSLLLEIIGKAMLGSSLALTFTPLGILIWLGVVIALSVFASIMPARNAARLTINEVLAYE
ncbi:MAG TPA: FtsX-like permease family protein [Anaerolineales bacterium]|jgi:putative ABC transport system permease protein